MRVAGCRAHRRLVALRAHARAVLLLGPSHTCCACCAEHRWAVVTGERGADAVRNYLGLGVGLIAVLARGHMVIERANLPISKLDSSLRDRLVHSHLRHRFVGWGRNESIRATEEGRNERKGGTHLW